MVISSMYHKLFVIFSRKLIMLACYVTKAAVKGEIYKLRQNFESFVINHLELLQLLVFNKHS